MQRRKRHCSTPEMSMSPHDAGFNGTSQLAQEEKKTLHGDGRSVTKIADSVAASSLRALALECLTKFPCNKPGVRGKQRNAQTDNRNPLSAEKRNGPHPERRSPISFALPKTKTHGRARSTRISLALPALILGDFPVSRDRLSRVELLFTRKPAPLRPSKFSFEYLLLQPRSAPGSAPRWLTPDALQQSRRPLTRRTVIVFAKGAYAESPRRSGFGAPRKAQPN